MRTIRISEEVWDEIAKRGIFGETPDIVLKRVFGLEKSRNMHHQPKRNDTMKTNKKDRYATDRLTTRIIDDSNILVSFASGKSREFQLPDRLNREAIRDLTSDVMKYVEDQEGTIGQINAARKALTDAGYHILK